MELPGWVYLVVGIIVSGFSGYFYYYIPKSDGTPNMAMALFFFIGIIFIVVGVFKILFRKMTKKHEEIEKHNVLIREKQTQQTFEPKMNRVEEQIKSIQQPQQTPSQTIPQQTQQAHHHLEHTNRWYNTHPYQGPHQKSTQQYTIINCPKCSAKNHSTSNFCHVCGSKLK